MAEAAAQDRPADDRPADDRPATDRPVEDRRGRVQSLERAFELLERLADAGGAATLTELASATGLPMPTIHRLMQSLVAGGYARQEANRRYRLGPRLIRLGQAAALALGAQAMPHLTWLEEQVGETANLAMLDGDSVVYLAQVPSRHSMRMFTEVGRRVAPHCTGVGKALLARLPEEAVLELVGRTGMPARTERTLTDPQALLRELATIRTTGYAVDDGEQEIGVRCVAVAVEHPAARLGISVSGPSARVTPERVAQIAPAVAEAATRLARDVEAAAVAGETGPG